MIRVYAMEFKISAGDIELQAHLREPEGEVQGKVVVCHPHPVYGGTMDNRIVYRAARSAARVGFAALRFNFRGVGESSGQYDHGLGEREDAAAAIEWIDRKYPGKPCAVVGYSFGAWVGLLVGSGDSRISAMVGIGLPLDLYNFDYLVDYSNPTLYIVGTGDEFCSQEKLDDLQARLPPSSKIALIRDADHFFSEHIEELEMIIENFFREWINHQDVQ
jgi:alpha/beta superfamily hydrolase